jgi:hypothetical protein
MLSAVFEDRQIPETFSIGSDLHCWSYRNVMLVTKRHRVGFDVSEENAESNSLFRLRIISLFGREKFFGGIGTEAVAGYFAAFSAMNIQL